MGMAHHEERKFFSIAKFCVAVLKSIRYDPLRAL